LEELRALVREYPDGVLASQTGYQEVYLDKWDRETATRRLTGVAANDCHHNQVFVLHKIDEATARLGTVVDPVESMRVVPVALRPGIARILAGRAPGERVVLIDVDPYDRAFRCVSTHVWASGLTEAELRGAVKAGRAYVAHTWMGDATGFRMAWLDAGEAEMSTRVRAWMG
jgi:hypothetical protein